MDDINLKAKKLGIKMKVSDIQTGGNQLDPLK
jgi:hypothetical protein